MTYHQQVHYFQSISSRMKAKNFQYTFLITMIVLYIYIWHGSMTVGVAAAIIVIDIQFP